jgi:hypothetical protein
MSTEPSTEPSTEQKDEEGRTFWGRAAIVFVPGMVVVGALGIAVAQGAMAASFAISGTSFSLSADKVVAKDLASYPGTSKAGDGKQHPTVLAGAQSAEITNMCAAQKVPTPFGDITMVVKSGQNGPVTATGLLSDMETLAGGKGTITNAQVGRDAATLDKVPGFTGPQGVFGTQADTVEVHDVKGTAWAGTAGTINFTGISVAVKFGGEGC